MNFLNAFFGRFFPGAPVFGSGKGFRPLNGPPAKSRVFFLSSAVRNRSMYFAAPSALPPGVPSSGE
jgi:hypothetical protein